MSEPDTLQHWIQELDRRRERPAIMAFGKNNLDEMTYQELGDLSRRFALGLQRRGVGPGDFVALFAPSSPAWITACLGILRACATPVPLDVQYDDDALVHVFSDSQPRYVLTDTRRAERLSKLELDSSAEIVLLDQPKDDDQRSWRHFLEKGDSDLPQASVGDDAILFYTSGTTGLPKGVPLTHENIAAQINVLLNADWVTEADRVLLPLPLHHVYPLVAGTLAPLARGLPVVLPHSLTGPQIVRSLQQAKVTVLIGVPRLYRALYDGMMERVESSGRIAKFTARAALAVSSSIRQRWGIRVGRWLLRPLHRQFGPHLRVVACGGSPLDDELAWKLESLGWQVAIGYGLTETSPLLTFNPPGRAKIGTVGKVISNTEVQIDDSDADVAEQIDGHSVGEIVARGPGVFSGYRHMPDKSNEVLTDDGWFHTGDLGYIDDEGYVHITGRKDTIIVTEGGEKVQPDDVENAYAEHPAIREIGVLAEDGRLVALLVPEPSAIDDGEDDLQTSISRAVEERGRDLPSYQRLHEFHLTRKSLPRTHLGKIQRHKLQERLKQLASEGKASKPQPVSIEELSSDDRALLDDQAAKQTWNLLCEKYADQHLDLDTSMHTDLGVDSLEWMNLSLSIRRRAGVEIAEDAIERIDTIRDLLLEASSASTTDEAKKAAATDEHWDASPLQHPQEVLSEHQRRYLQPHNRFQVMLARGIFAINRVLMRILFRLEVHGLDQLPDEPIVIVPNHASYLDAPAVAAALPWQRLRRTYWGGWTGIMFTNFMMRWFSRLTHVVPVDPHRQAMSSLAFGAAVLRRNHSLVWFPEGERSTDGQLLPFRSGIGLLLQTHSAIVIPTAIEGAHQALPPGSWLPRLHTIRVTFGQPRDIDTWLEIDEEDEPESQIATALQEAVAELLHPTQ